MVIEIVTTGLLIAVGTIAVGTIAVGTIATYKILAKSLYSNRSYMAGLTQAERDVARQGLAITLSNAWVSPLRDGRNFWIDPAWEQGYADYLASAQAKQANKDWEASQCK